MIDAPPHFEGTFDIAPVAKGRPRVANGHAYTPAATKRFEADLGLLVRVRMNKARTRRLVGPVALEVRYLPRRGSRPDGDNVFKAVADSLQGILYENDSQIVDLRCVLLVGGAPRVCITAWDATEQGGTE